MRPSILQQQVQREGHAERVDHEADTPDGDVAVVGPLPAGDIGGCHKVAGAIREALAEEDLEALQGEGVVDDIHKRRRRLPDTVKLCFQGRSSHRDSQPPHSSPDGAALPRLSRAPALISVRSMGVAVPFPALAVCHHSFPKEVTCDRGTRDQHRKQQLQDERVPIGPSLVPVRAQTVRVEVVDVKVDDGKEKEGSALQPFAPVKRERSDRRGVLEEDEGEVDRLVPAGGDPVHQVPRKDDGEDAPDHKQSLGLKALGAAAAEVEVALGAVGAEGSLRLPHAEAGRVGADEAHGLLLQLLRPQQRRVGPLPPEHQLLRGVRVDVAPAILLDRASVERRAVDGLRRRRAVRRTLVDGRPVSPVALHGVRRVRPAVTHAAFGTGEALRAGHPVPPVESPHTSTGFDRRGPLVGPGVRVHGAYAALRPPRLVLVGPLRAQPAGLAAFRRAVLPHGTRHAHGAPLSGAECPRPALLAL
mmetsp:Transcript_32885/g.77992  ORF Transcript_32885/g.77992 Transcript_32885/m.77992 type:complete len:474 (-) Transcript_32885:2288-3709(-)